MISCFFTKNQFVTLLTFISFFLASCTSSNQPLPLEEATVHVEFPVGYIAQSLSTDLYDTTELYPLPEEFVESFMQKYTQYEGKHPVMAAEFPEEWGVVVVERLPEGRELYQIQSLNREWVFLLITSGYGTHRILDVLPVAANLAHQSKDILETEIWTTEREVDGTFAVTKKYEWKRSLENVTQKEFEENPRDYVRSQTFTDKYSINDFARFEITNTEDIPDYSALIFYFKEKKPDDYEELVPMMQAYCEDYSILFADVDKNFSQVELYDYKLNFITALDITPYMDLQEGVIFMKKGETPKTVPYGSYERLKIETKRYFRIVES
jgi:hypothetical protein